MIPFLDLTSEFHGKTEISQDLKFMLLVPRIYLRVIYMLYCCRQEKERRYVGVVGLIQAVRVII